MGSLPETFESWKLTGCFWLLLFGKREEEEERGKEVEVERVSFFLFERKERSLDAPTRASNSN